MIRLFVGLSIPADITALLKIMCSGVPGARWVDPSNMHITLRFIGEVEEYGAEEIDGTLSKISANKFELALKGLGIFGRGQKTRALWARVIHSELLNHLHAKVESAVVRSGQSPEKRKFIPHVTLARFSSFVDLPRLESFAAGNNLFQSDPFDIDHFTLFESTLGKNGPVYTPLATYGLS